MARLLSDDLALSRLASTQSQAWSCLDTVRRMARIPFVWGQSDCGNLVMDHVEAAGHVLPWRPHWDDEAGCAAACASAGGLAALAGLVFDPVLARTDHPETGDVVVMDLPQVGPCCGLRVNGGWAFKTMQGVMQFCDGIYADARMIAAWAVGR